MDRIEFINKQQELVRGQITRLQLLIDLPEEKLLLSANGKWNAIEHIHHILLTARPYLDPIEDRLKTPEKSSISTFTSGYFGNLFTKSMMPVNGEIKSPMKTLGRFDPAKSGHYPEYNNLSNQELIQKLVDTLNRVDELLELAKTVDLNKNKVNSSLGPIFRFKLGDAFGFMIAHIERHIFLIEKSGITF